MLEGGFECFWHLCAPTLSLWVWVGVYGVFAVFVVLLALAFIVLSHISKSTKTLPCKGAFARSHKPRMTLQASGMWPTRFQQPWMIMITLVDPWMLGQGLV